jgi:DNA repair exonuclease SbcCD nuclease subunit
MLLGDSGSGNLLQHKFAKVIRDNQPDAILHAGDIVYNFKSGPPNYYNDFRHFSAYKTHMKSVPYFTTIGNHELYHGDAAYLNAFHLPTNNLPTLGLKPPNLDYPFSGTEHFYSFDVGDAHVSVRIPRVVEHRDVRVADIERVEMFRAGKRVYQVWRFQTEGGQVVCRQMKCV